ncbi:MAG TPA: polyprenyl synthetase family protein, partial [Chloroflexota bacterium]|nr:polyprenyl synthetase family protein [Chloroflexota bacterium]
DLVSVERALTQAVESEGPTMRRLLGLVLPGSGKRLRPALALVCGRVNDFRPDRLIPFAAALEMLHTATLVHDDIVDEADVRRGAPTLNAHFNNSIAVLVGDFMFAQAADHAVRTEDFRVITRFTRAAMTILGGQIDESWANGSLGMTKEQYFQRIGNKTAALFALSAEGGAILSGASQPVIEAVKQYGHLMGLAFQIVDDILDVVGDEATLGKPVGSDVRQGTVTLPALMVRDRLTPEQFRAAFNGDGRREEPIRVLLETIRQQGGIELSYREADRLVAEACAALKPLPAGEVRDSLEDLAHFVVRRDV